MKSYVRIAGVWKLITRMYVKQAGAWKEILAASTRASGAWKIIHRPTLYYTISSNQVDVNVFSLFGSPSYAVYAVLTIDSGVTVSASSTSATALDTGTFPSNSTLHIINNGRIAGAGGNGGTGATGNNTGGNGSPGGDSMILRLDTTITNGSGEIFGGGGGGGGGGAQGTSGSSWLVSSGGGGGGGGQGVTGGNGGAGGANVVSGCNPAQSGNGGSSAGAGAGGRQGEYLDGSCYTNIRFGGDGGSWGSAGNGGQSGYTSNGPNTGGGSGGAAGKAIELNGNSVTWVSGSASPNVLGAVS